MLLIKNNCINIFEHKKMIYHLLTKKADISPFYQKIIDYVQVADIGVYHHAFNINDKPYISTERTNYIPIPTMDLTLKQLYDLNIHVILKTRRISSNMAYDYIKNKYVKIN